MDVAVITRQPELSKKQPKLSRVQLTQAVKLLNKLLLHCGCESSHRVIFTPYITGIVKNNHLATTESHAEFLSESLKPLAALGFIAVENDTIITVSNGGAIPTPVIKVTPLKPKQLLQILNAPHPAAEQQTIDPVAYTQLPKMIKKRWSFFSDQLKIHILDCIEHLHTQQMNRHRFFALAERPVPHIPVQLSGDTEPCDLMEAVTRLQRTDLCKLTPATEKTEVDRQALQQHFSNF